MSQHVLAENAYRAGSRQEETEDDRKRRRLSGAVAAEQRRRDAARDGKADPVHRNGGRVLLDEVLDFDCGFKHRPYMTRYRVFGQHAAGNPARDTGLIEALPVNRQDETIR